MHVGIIIRRKMAEKQKKHPQTPPPPGILGKLVERLKSYFPK
jgi:hypothetical protein